MIAMANTYERIESFIRNYIREYNECERIGAGLADGDRYLAMNTYWADDILFVSYAQGKQEVPGREVLKGLMTKATKREEIEIVDLLVDEGADKASALYHTRFFHKDGGAPAEEFDILALYTLDDQGAELSIARIDLFRGGSTTPAAVAASS
jgi:hypothetical protein